MATLHIKQIEKHMGNKRIFPSFDFELRAGEMASVYAASDIRTMLMKVLAGDAAVSNGSIHVGDIPVTLGGEEHLTELGLLFLTEGHYGRLRVKDHLLFYKRLYQADLSVDEVLERLQLVPEKHSQVQHLSSSEQRRVQLARYFFQNPEVLVIEEPFQNMDMETKRIFMNVFKVLQEEGKSILVLTENLESAITLSEKVYRLDEQGLSLVQMEEDREHHTEEDEEEMNTEPVETTEPIPFNKLPTKVQDKLILFDPPEVDYIESQDGQSHLYVRGEAFPCAFTLNELEEKLHSYGFYRCHRSYIVNLQKVREIITWTRNSFSLRLNDTDKSEIPLSKAKMADLREMMGLK
ncbi:LytTR family transcriptional regulator DNA-binding domain-containing protein [Salsuginibacillus kocurii]|uniref:LytTR family transcriptional regulator DNA-binding domain-containing protein n=1 Tax=Salsuginibacillus kocurii TaxID=427078 RepID=UPI0003652B90|nr:LytTR family transcriptional regulator DNA-binding domain-containing protein [Salsuginibacillus kocurii]